MATTHRNRTPSLLEPYLALPPEQSLILLTSTLSCSANWLTARIASTALQQEDTSVLLVSWMRDQSFWKDELRRAAGLDISRLSPSFQYLDCFTDVLSAGTAPDKQVAATERRLIEAITNLTQQRPSNRILLVLDDPTPVLATSTNPASEALSTMLLTLRSQPSVHSTLLSIPADLPFVSAATPDSGSASTPLEIELAAFAVQQAHSARLVMSVREIGTGAAKDVSGVLRITRGGGAFDLEGEDGAGEEVREMEKLYLVGRDGGVKIVE